MKRNNRKIVIAWCVVSMSSSMAEERQPVQVATPPPAVTSSYFTPPAPTTPTPTSGTTKPAEIEKKTGADQVSLGSGATNSFHTPVDHGASSVIHDTTSANVPASVSSDITNPIHDSLENGHDHEQAMNSTHSDVHDDNDASTGLHGAHVTKGINFESQPEEDAFSMGGVDTTHLKHVSGNWIEKKHYWQEIEGVVDHIKEKIIDIGSKRTAFFATRSEVDKELSTFYQHVGLDQGPLQDMIHYSLEIMDKEKEKQGFLNKKERMFYEKAQSKQRVFEQLKEDVKAIGVIDKKIDEALDVVLKQVNACNEYEQEVWNIYKTVAYELSEKEAEQHYFVAQAFLKDIENIQIYLSGPFQSYFQELAESIQTHTQNIVMQLDTLEKEGLSLKKEATIFETEEEEQLHKDQDHKEELKKADDKKTLQNDLAKTEKKNTSNRSFIGYVSDFFTSLKNSISSIVDKISGLFGKKNKHDIPVLKEKSVVKEPAEELSSHNVAMQKDETAVAHKESTPAVKKTSQLEETIRYDEERFAQEMAELKKTIETGAQEVIDAPTELFHSLEQKL